MNVNDTNPGSSAATGLSSRGALPRTPEAHHQSATVEQEPFGPVIYSYTRADAMADGYLVDVTETAREAGFRCAVAITRAAWNDCVEWTDEDAERKHWPQDEQGRLWDVLMMARFACRRSAGASLIRFEVVRVPRPGCGRRRKVALAAQIGPGDAGEAVITIGQPSDF